MIRDLAIASVGLLLADPADRRLVTEFLSQIEFNVLVIGEPDTDPDLESASVVIVDEAAARRHGESLFSLKKRMHPLYLPLLLMLPESASTKAWLRAGFDDVLRMPLPRDELGARLEVFLRLRQHSEEALIQSEYRFNTTFDLAPVGIVHTSPEGRFLRANRKFCDMLEYHEDDLTKRSIADVTHFADMNQHAETCNVLWNKPGGAIRVFEKRYLHKDGSAIWANVNVSLVRDKQGDPKHFIAVVEDISERKQMEETLRESERFARSTIDALFTHICVVDETGTIIAVNQAWRDFAESNGMLSSDVSEGANYLAVCDAAGNDSSPEATAIAAGIRDLLEGKRSEFSLEYACHSPTEQRWFIARGTRFPGEGPTRVVISHVDTTERNRTEMALRESEAEFRTLAEAMPQMVWITRADGWKIYFNQQWMDYTGLTLAESLGHGWNKPFHPDDQQRALDAWQQAMATGHTYSLESRLRRADGVYRWWLIRGAPLKDATGNIVKWFGTCTDVHDMKLAELELSHTNQVLRKSEIRIKYMNRIYAMLRGINSLIVCEHDREILFKEACRIAVDVGEYRMAMIFIVDRSTMKIVPGASMGKDDELLTSINHLLSSSKAASNTMVARAIREKKAVVSNDSQSDHQVLLGRKYAEFGVRSMAVMPMIVADEAIGVLALYASEIEHFRDDEMKLLTELTGDIAFGIDHIDKQERLDYLAYYDVLTGIANRSLFLERMTQYMHSADSSGNKLALFLIDLERFKNVNDSLGRTAGDGLLRQVAEWLTCNAGDTNLVARVGADQFAMLLPEVRQEDNMTRLLESTMETFQNHQFHLNDGVFQVAAKVGVALFPDHGGDADALFRNAEAALKKAKARGDRYLFYTDQMMATVSIRLTLENQLRQALDKGEFVLHYQPKVNLLTGKVSGAEALIRWNDPRTGLVPPGHFIPILEETGLIYEVGRWALRQAIDDYLRWRAAGRMVVPIAVNVSPLQLRHHGFIAEIEQVISIAPQAAAGLELEITESLIMEDVKHSIGNLQAIRAMGVSIAIDDFGTGFSSLSYLAKLPVDSLKIDRSFIIDMTAAPEGLALVSTIISLAHALKLKVVAEGVETEEQSRLLRLLNCDQMQGFLFSKPVPSEVFELKYLALPPGA